MSLITKSKFNKTSDLQKINQQIIDFTNNCGCSEKDALLFLKRGSFDFEYSVALFTLTRLISRPRGNSKTRESGTKKILTEVNYDSDQIKPSRLSTTETVMTPNFLKESNGFGFNTSACSINLQPLCYTNNSFIYDENKPLDFETLKRYLKQKPSPPWRERLRAFKLYNNELIMGFPEALYTREKIIIDKRVFKLYLEINKGAVTSKNLQRGVTAFLERIGFCKIQNRSRTFMEFYWGEGTNKH
ncbi:hypothetical protein M0813_10153 [Anaeramoeba flamelloides]|uniref:Uncharacterized protein n=1 Tax=Anaeramoeba flamelloides TaxID=1746091 RepID=A0ABQ8X3L6_9EUKA|nr:hypothetical protein M0813_10153 [Anaeramoeba flamelloides]